MPPSALRPGFLSQSGKVRVWGVNKDLKCEVAAVSGSVDDIEWSDDGQRIVAGGDGRGKIVKVRVSQIPPFNSHSPLHISPPHPR